PDDGVQTGLFLDHRETRWRARDFSAGHEVLNLFAYTCAFSVHAALAGAERVTSVDVSQRSLSWGRRNMALSGLDPNRHRWFADDVLAHLRRPRGTYGLVILDPPVFGHGRRPFSLERDLVRLLRGAFSQLAPGGVLIFSTHHTGLTDPVLEAACREAALGCQRTLDLIERRGLPEWDHPISGDPTPGDRGNYLRTLCLRVN
ncbi:MAG: class I SAM-dependent methyltransferase, partial [Myxococcota bacterium]